MISCKHCRRSLATFIRNLSLAYDVELHERDSLIFFDEVQLFPPTREMIKLLVADGRFDYMAIHAQEPLAACARKAREVAESPRASRLADAARIVGDGYMETLTYARFPMEHWRRIRTNNGIGRLNREIKRRTRAVASFPDSRSATLLAAARCKHVAEGSWGGREGSWT